MTESPTEPRARDGAFRGLLGVVVAVLLVPMGIAGLRTYGDLVRADARKAALAARIADAEREVDRLERRIADLESRPETIEGRARSDLGMVYPGEVVIVLPPSPGSPANPRSPLGPVGGTAVAPPAGPRIVEPGDTLRGKAPTSVMTAVAAPGEP